MDVQEFGDRIYTNSLRGFAIIMVVAHHFCGKWSNILTPLGGTGVAIFLLMSGYGLNESYKKNGLDNFWKKRFFRIFIPNIIVAVSLKCLDIISYKDLFLTVTCIKTVYWYVSYLVYCYFVFWLTTKYFYRYRLIMIGVLGTISVFLPFPLQAEQGLSFFLGVVLSQRGMVLGSHLGNKYTIALGALAIGTFLLRFKQFPFVRELDTPFFNVVQLGIKLSYAVFFIIFFSYIKIIHRSLFLYVSGNLSYEIYLIHIQLYRFNNGHLDNTFILIALSFFISVILFYLNRYIQKSLNRLLAL
ncbi:MAG: acyltransferase family protein [Bacteroidales bacterium]|nr:acyltransferase family protein [Bacteroidales bacterium]